MIRTMTNPWPPYENVMGSRCWCCHRDFTEKEPIKVIDCVVPKLVHDKEPCALAMIQMVQGQ